MTLNLKMNKFATIVKLFEFREVTFYSILIEDEEIPMGLQFLENHNQHPDMPVLRAWLTKIGNERGAMNYFFRDESFNGSAQALPPPINVSHDMCSLRWYCMRMSPAAVVVFNGGEKTAQTAQDCPNVRPHFLLANNLSNKIWAAFDAREIRLDDNDRLKIDDDFEIEI